MTTTAALERGGGASYMDIKKKVHLREQRELTEHRDKVEKRRQGGVVETSRTVT